MRGTRKDQSAKYYCLARIGSPPGVASRVCSFHVRYWVLWDDLLSATGPENTFERILQCSSGCHGDGSTLSRSGSPDPGLPQLRSEAGTAISRGNSLNRWRRRYDVAGNNRFPLALAYALVIS